MIKCDPKAMLPGVGVTLLVALIATMVSFLHVSFDALVMSIILGVLVSSMIGDKQVFGRGVEASIRIFLPLGITLFGSQLVLKQYDYKLVIIVIASMLLFFVVTYTVSKAFGLGRTMSALIGTGMAVCGASAIVIISPLLGSKKEETSISIISVMTVGLTGMLCYRFAPDMLHISAEKFALLTGLTLPMVGQVKVAASAMGPDTVAVAMKYKLMRVAALVVFTAAAVLARRRSGDGDYKGFPWYLIGFYLMAIFVNFTSIGGAIRGVLEPVSRFMLAAALAAVGLSVDIDSVAEKGPSPIMAAFLSAGISVLVVALGLGLMK